MTKTTHTHRGTCQSCGRKQAVDNTTQLLAKHGYTVKYGAFHFVCQGASGHKPAEFDVTLTRTTMATCLETAAYHAAEIPKLKSGEVVPDTFNRWNPNKPKVTRTSWGEHKSRGDYDTLPIAQATDTERSTRIQQQIRYHEIQEDGLRDHEKFLRTEVLPRLGMPLYAVADMVKPAPPVAPTVDIEAAKVTGTFATKAARKQALETLGRAYDKARDELQALYLALPYSQRTKARMDIYYGAMQLSNWRPKHAEATLREYPEAAPIVERITKLVAAREAIKTAP